MSARCARAFIAHFAPYVRDVVIAGADRNAIAALIFPDLDACRRLAADLAARRGSGRRSSRTTPCGAHFAPGSRASPKAATGSSNRVARAILADTPPSLDVGEATDKGSINQRMVLRHRAALVDELYAAAPSARVIVAHERVDA